MFCSSSSFLLASHQKPSAKKNLCDGGEVPPCLVQCGQLSHALRERLDGLQAATLWT